MLTWDKSGETHLALFVAQFRPTSKGCKEPTNRTPLLQAHPLSLQIINSGRDYTVRDCILWLHIHTTLKCLVSITTTQRTMRLRSTQRLYHEGNGAHILKEQHKLQRSNNSSNWDKFWQYTTSVDIAGDFNKPGRGNNDWFAGSTGTGTTVQHLYNFVHYWILPSQVLQVIIPWKLTKTHQF